MANSEEAHKHKKKIGSSAKFIPQSFHSTFIADDEEKS